MFKRFICWILRFVALVFGGPGEKVPFARHRNDHGNGYRQQAAPRRRARVTGTRQHGDVESNELNIEGYGDRRFTPCGTA